MTRARRHKAESKHGELIKTAAIWGAALLALIGIIVAQSAETIKTGYQISALNTIWQEKNFEHMTLARRINNYTETGKTEKFVERQFNLRRAEPAQIVFMDDKNASK
ncbi:MAG: hypothetical protein COZ15_01945 [Elusimicrobia bacterium CG_4_10_14_3_um_filter_49_12_50_7]|nr:MAG: hypothetical protein COS41_02270 [Elusimicrobia bacterium CG03_land_8_20_14_0_80_50_18]PIX14586.1 MAG: hypothetical protein COZ72_05700 [Elusimicrobia bacterium CG_4_8_14_3_um_filter_50_9]PIY17741.1 MAG: hypothetical protein COZ15_01945 [Elusimicrobia bacterium CG_4_10_14_3_um_filter_49_12_50_7]